MTHGDGHERIEVACASRDYEVIVGPGLLDDAGRIIATECRADKAFVISDTNVAPLYLERVLASLREAGLVASSIVVEAGEAHKTLRAFETILEAMAAADLTRDSMAIALGGGVVGDMAGFAAATYMRGIQVVQMPTSLLAMVDSSVGGKTAIDLSCGKNLVGAFLQPSLVVADVQTLRTLEPAVFLDGIGEVVKHGVLCDAKMFRELDGRPLKQDSPDSYLTHIIAKNVIIKRNVVQNDEQEHGLRQTLNLGHTIGHAIEAASGFTLGHGHCVATGLCCVARAAERLGWAQPGLAKRIESCTQAQGLPIATDIPVQELIKQASHDKKRHGKGVNLVVPTEIGHVELRYVSLDELAEIIRIGIQ